MRPELEILNALQTLHTPILDELMCGITRLGNAGTLWIILGIILLLFPSKNRSGQIVLIAICLETILCNGILKDLFGRIRPFDINTSIHLLIPRPSDYSFPSGHTAVSFAAVTALYLSGEHILWKIFLIPAILISFSRMYLYVHYPTDILGGIFLGFFSGYVAYRIYFYKITS